MSDHKDEQPSGAEAANGHPAPIAIPPAPRERPAGGFGRIGATHAIGASDLDAIGGLSSRTGGKLAATTRVMNSVLGYYVNALGRAPDQLTEGDVAALGSILATLERLEPGARRPAHA